MGSLRIWGGPPGRLISQGEQYSYGRRAVADTVVDTPEEDATAPIAFDECEPPQRPIHVQGSVEQLRYGVVEGFHIPRRRQDDALNVRARRSNPGSVCQ